MTKDNLLRKESENSKSEQIARYTLLFIITAVCVYVLFIVVPRTFLSNADGNIDGIAQQYPIYSEIKRKVHALLTGQGWSSWSWDIGLGDDSLMEFNTKLLNPLTYIVIAFPQKYLDIGFTLMVLVEQYLSGLFFLLFGRKLGFSDFQLKIGALSYAFCGWSMYALSRQGTFLIATMLFPILILGTEKLFRGESPVLFMVAVALHVIYSIQWAYVAGIAVCLFFVTRYLTSYKSADRCFGRILAEFIGCGLIGIMMSGLVLTGNLIKMLETTTESLSGNAMLYTVSQYFEIPTGLFLMTTTTEAYTVLGISALSVILLPVAMKNVTNKGTAAILSLSLFVLSLLPLTGSIFNGMSYTVGRWYYVMIFFMIWATMDAFTDNNVSSRSNIRLMFIWLSALALWGIVICYLVLGIIGKDKAIAIAGGALAGYLLIWLFFKGVIISDRNNQIRVTVVVIASLVVTFNAEMFPYLGEKIHTLCQVGRIEEDLSGSTQRIGPELQQDDTSFYRIDQVDGYTDARIARVRANENMYFGNRSIYTYLSTMDSGWHNFSKLMGNNAGYFDRTTVYSNDNREGLDFLMGVKYFLGDSGNKKPGANDYAPYGYSYYKNIDDVQILKNKYCMGLGTTYTKYITESELMEYHPLEREQVILQAAVVSDADAEKLTGVKHATSDEISTDITSIDVQPEGMEGGTFTVDKEHHAFNLSVPQIENARVVVAFEGLVRKTCDFETELALEGKKYKKNALARAVQRISYEDDEKFKIELTRGNVVKAAQMRKGKNQGYSDVRDFYVNLGYYDSIDGDVNINIDRVGEYSFDAIKLYIVPMDIYNECATLLSENKITVESFDKDSVKGTLNAIDNAIMYCSVLNQNGWDIYIDGNKVNRLEDGVNITFLGTEIEKGQHEIEMKYRSPGLLLGMIISCVGIALAIIIGGKNRREI